MLDKIKVLILDFDGVIVESVGIKTNAFRRLFEVYPDKIEEIIDFHLKNDGLSRYKKFDYIYDEILRMPLDSGISERLGKRFSELVVEEIKSCSYVLGAVELLEKYYQKIPIYIASGTPEPELNKIIAAKGLTKYFKAAYGSPASKSEISQRILEIEAVAPEDALFIGDTITDYTEASKAGVRFIGRVSHSLLENNPLSALDVPLVRDFTTMELNNVL